MEVVGFISGDGCYVVNFCFRWYVVVGLVLFCGFCCDDCWYDSGVDFGDSD